MKYMWYASVDLVHHASCDRSVKWCAMGVPIACVREVHASVLFHHEQSVLYANLSTQATIYIVHAYQCITQRVWLISKSVIK